MLLDRITSRNNCIWWLAWWNIFGNKMPTFSELFVRINEAEFWGKLSSKDNSTWSQCKLFSFPREEKLLNFSEGVNTERTHSLKYWDINNQYCLTCQLSASITHQSLRLNASIHLSMISIGISWHSSTMASLKDWISVILWPWYTFCSRCSQIPQFAGVKSPIY